MALIVGLLLAVFGLIAVVVWFPAVVVFLKGLIAFSLLFWGLLVFIIGFARSKAKREYKKSLYDSPAPEENLS